MQDPGEHRALVRGEQMESRGDLTPSFMLDSKEPQQWGIPTDPAGGWLLELGNSVGKPSA